MLSIQQQCGKKNPWFLNTEITRLWSSWSSLSCLESLSLIWEKLVIFFALLVSNFTFHWLYALILSRYVILFWEAYLWVGTFLLVTYLIYLKVCFSTIFFFLQSFHCLCNNWIAIYFNYNVCLCYHSIKHCIKTPQI